MNTLYIPDELAENGLIEAYDRAHHGDRIRSFLYWKGGHLVGESLLIVGTHKPPHYLLYDAYHRALGQRPARSTAGIVGGGTCENGRVLSWTSHHYQLTIHNRNLKADIIKALGFEQRLT